MCFGDPSSRTRSNDKLEPQKNIFEIANHYLQDKYLPGSCITGNKQLITFNWHCPFQVYITLKSTIREIKIVYCA